MTLGGRHPALARHTCPRKAHLRCTVTHVLPAPEPGTEAEESGGGASPVASTRAASRPIPGFDYGHERSGAQ